MKLIVLISGNGSNLQAIIDAIHADQIAAEITLVISNTENAYGLERAQQAGIPTAVLSNNTYNTREAYDQALMTLIEQQHVDLILLAGFMRILTTKFVEHFHPKILNIHPSLLPKYRGLDTHAQVIDAGDTTHGCSVHIVTPELDSGPIILQSVIKVDMKDTPTSLQQKVHQQEHMVYPLVIGWYANGTLNVDNGRIYYHDTLIPPEGLCLQDLEAQ